VKLKLFKLQFHQSKVLAKLLSRSLRLLPFFRRGGLSTLVGFNLLRNLCEIEVVQTLISPFESFLLSFFTKKRPWRQPKNI